MYEAPRAETTALLTASLCPTVELYMRVALYCRVSTKDQNCSLQLNDLRAYCASRQLTVVREYIDAGQSGAQDSRPELNAMMSDARKRKLDMVLVWRWDRFARSTRHLLLALEEFRALKVQFVSFQEDIDTGTPIGQVLFTLIAAMAELERNLIVERVCAGIRNARVSGKHLGRPRQYVDLDRIRDMRAAGMSLRQVAEKLAVGYGTVRTALESSERKTPGKSGGELAPFTGVPATL